MTTKAALLIFREHNNQKELLVVKTFDRKFYIFPVGVQENNEPFETILHAQAKTQLNVEIENIEKLGVAKGATPSGVPLEMHLFMARAVGEPEAYGDVERLWWMTREEAFERQEDLTPIAFDEIFPLLKERSLW